MIPTSVKVKNFGAIPAVEIELTGISLASIVGQNGRGKSTLFTWAPLYALFGKTKNGCSVDDMVLKGQQDMLVQFDFEHQGIEYRVMRTRSLKGKGKSTLELQRLVDGRYESLSGATIAETEAKIRELLNLDANTFVSSSMILQNDSANFTQKPPGERKAILTQILGLEIYDRLQQAAKEHEKHLTIELETSKNKLADLEEKLQALPEANLQLANIANAIALNAVSIREKETALSDTHALIKGLEGKEQQARDLKRQMDDICTAIMGNQAETSEHNAKIGRAETILESEPEILAKVAELEEVKAKIPALQAKEDRVVQLKIDGNRLFDELNSYREELTNIEGRIEALEHELSARDDLKQASADYQQGLQDLNGMDENAGFWQFYQNDIVQAEKQLEQYGSRLSRLRTELKNCETKANLLHTANCPVSGEVNCVFLADATEAKKQVPIVDGELQTAEKEHAAIQDIIKGLTEQQEGLAYDKANHAALKKRVESLRLKAEAYAQLNGKEELLQNLKEQRENNVGKLNANKFSANEIKRELANLQAETADLPDLQKKIPELEPYLTMKDKLPEARTTIQLSQEAIEKLQAEIAIKNDQYQHLLTDYAFLSQKFAGELPKSREAAQDIEGELKGLQAQLNALYAQQGTYKAKLDALLKDAEEKDRLSAELAPQAKELVRWQTLVKAFSKNGIPALIIENSIPELERISNDILSQMSNGAHSLRFETQRDLKSKDGVAETLDIIVSDWAGSRPYETYSGGEQLRIDLAIRFALAELLANRAGSKVEWIVADEIFGSQDTEHRGLVIDAIKSVADRFRMILVISHITEAQAAFDQQIILGESGKVEIVYS